MGSESTVYDIRLRYMLEDRASGRAQEMERSLERVAATSKNAGLSLGRLGAIAASAFGFHQAKKSLIDFNSSLEQSKIGMAGMFELNLGGAFSENMERSNALVDRLQVRMKTAVGTTAEAVQIASQLAQPFSAASASLKQMEDMTVGVVVGSKAMGVATEVAARDVDQALRGQFHSVDQFTGKLLGARGYAGEEGRRKFNAMSMEKRFSTLNTALNDPALKDMANAQASSYAGVLSTFQDNLEIFMGKVGKPLFQSITKELKQWNEWLDANGETLERIGREAGEYLVAGFQMIKDAVTYVIDHKDTLLTIAKAYAAIKIGSSAFGMAGGIASQVGGLIGAGGGLAGVLTSLATAGAAAAAGLVLVTEASKAMDNKRSEPLFKRSQEYLQFSKMSAGAKSNLDSEQVAKVGLRVKGMLQTAQEYGLLDEDGKFKAKGQALAESISEASKRAGFYEMDDRQAAFMEAMYRLAQDISAGRIDSAATLGLNRNVRDTNDPANKTPRSKDIKVTINRIEVKSDDPDRFVFGLQEALNNTVNNGAASMAALVR